MRCEVIPLLNHVGITLFTGLLCVEPCVVVNLDYCCDRIVCKQYTVVFYCGIVVVLRCDRTERPTALLEAFGVLPKPPSCGGILCSRETGKLASTIIVVHDDDSRDHLGGNGPWISPRHGTLHLLTCRFVLLC